MPSNEARTTLRAAIASAAVAAAWAPARSASASAISRVASSNFLARRDAALKQVAHAGFARRARS